MISRHKIIVMDAPIVARTATKGNNYFGRTDGLLVNIRVSERAIQSPP